MRRAYLFLSLSVFILVGCKITDSVEKKTNLGWEELIIDLPEEIQYQLTIQRVSEFAALGFDCLDRQYPCKQAYVMDGDDTVRPPKQLIPAFFGCFDWHSAVHSHWMLVRLLKLYPKLPEARSIRKKLNKHLNPKKLQKELRFFQAKRNETFERPYGWGWLLRLMAELSDFEDPQAKKWRKAVKPLADYLYKQSMDYFKRLSAPVREGTHQSTAFAMIHMLDYARMVQDQELAKVIDRRAKDFYLHDRNCPIGYEPSGEDFISPCLAEADLLRRLLPREEFIRWLDDFLQAPDNEKYKSSFLPTKINDLQDSKMVHLVGLSLQRAWSLYGIASVLPEEDKRRKVFQRLAGLHRDNALEKIFDSGYGGKHWLASFAVYLLTEVGM